MLKETPYARTSTKNFIDAETSPVQGSLQILIKVSCILPIEMGSYDVPGWNLLSILLLISVDG